MLGREGISGVCNGLAILLSAIIPNNFQKEISPKEFLSSKRDRHRLDTLRYHVHSGEHGNHSDI